MIYKNYSEVPNRDHPFKTSACLWWGGVSPFADGQKVTVYKDKKTLHKHFAGMPMVGGRGQKW